jgi:hypothetical protein
MAEAAYATGLALLGAPRLLSSIFSRFFCSLFHRGTQIARQCGAPKSLSSPENVRPQNLKSGAPKSGAPNGFFVPCFNAGPKQPKYHRKLEAKNLALGTSCQSLKSEAPNSGPQTKFFVPTLGKGLQNARPKSS